MFFISSFVSIFLMLPSLKFGFFIMVFIYGFASFLGFSFPYPVLARQATCLSANNIFQYSYKKEPAGSFLL